MPLAARRPHERATTTPPTHRHGHVVYESSQFRAGPRAPAVGNVDEIHLLNHATIAGEDLSDHLKYFTEHLPATFVYAGINVEKSGLFTGIRGKQLAGRCIMVRTGRFPCTAEWRALVASLENTLRLHRHQAGTLVKQSKYLHQRTGGMIGSLSHLIRAAAISAILDGSEHITKTSLRAVRIDHNSESEGPPEPPRAVG
ncbi:hypothetical protein QQY66_21875 [Streptomyces sp. DG2A-72]|uniref:hypothetical protein n=1 Tax=Streptomyces sp. DG2A-72 TaxID=3051386 RepID=UPI00265C2E21|nr:hypothetical protein [Streptomyces sp. DG2A-72]MDO0934210.1 hypothetical protein [Streptomyces sp. DG2A-72]